MSLNKLGIRADAVANGLEAIEAVRNHTYDVILMDVQMPELDGLAATHQIRNTNLRQQPYIIAVTANATIEDREQCLAAGMNAYMSKPYRLRDLRRCLLDFVQSKPSDAPATVLPAPKSNQASIFSQAGLDQLTAMFSEDQAGMDEFLNGSLPDLERQMNVVAEARNIDALSLRNAAHSLKRSSGALASHELQQCAGILETNARNGAFLEAVNGDWEKVRFAYDRFVKAVQERAYR